jgi:hypothetical protein
VCSLDRIHDSGLHVTRDVIVFAREKEQSGDEKKAIASESSMTFWVIGPFYVNSQYWPTELHPTALASTASSLPKGTKATTGCPMKRITRHS